MTRNAAGVPTALMTRPATAGPVIRARLKAALFSAMAFAIPSRPTISATNVCRVGLSTTATMPSANASRYTCQTATAPVSASTPRMSASAPIAAWVANRMRRLG